MICLTTGIIFILFYFPSYFIVPYFSLLAYNFSEFVEGVVLLDLTRKKKKAKREKATHLN